MRIVNNDKTCGVFFIAPKFKEQIKELLAQPEQEPVAWAIVFDAEPNTVCEDYLST